MMSMSASFIKRKSTLLLREAAKRFIFRSATTFLDRKHLRENALLCTFYIAVMHFGVWLLICIYAIKIKQKLICIAVYYAACLILWDDLHFKTNSYNII